MKKFYSRRKLNQPSHKATADKQVSGANVLIRLRQGRGGQGGIRQGAKRRSAQHKCCVNPRQGDAGKFAQT